MNWNRIKDQAKRAALTGVVFVASVFGLKGQNKADLNNVDNNLGKKAKIETYSSVETNLVSENTIQKDSLYEKSERLDIEKNGKVKTKGNYKKFSSSTIKLSNGGTLNRITIVNNNKKTYKTSYTDPNGKEHNLYKFSRNAADAMKKVYDKLPPEYFPNTKERMMPQEAIDAWNKTYAQGLEG